ncbi:MAG TPA: hypothetical protein VEC99_08510, partial [Clostridia bacterium]|nr:hypothetical protein [Clostridia bacterium]
GGYSNTGTWTKAVQGKKKDAGMGRTRRRGDAETWRRGDVGEIECEWGLAGVRPFGPGHPSRQAETFGAMGASVWLSSYI